MTRYIAATQHFVYVPEAGVKIIIGADSEFVPRGSSIYLVDRESLKLATNNSAVTERIVCDRG